MDDVVKNMLEGGLTPQLMFDLFLVVLVILIVLWIRGWIVRYLAYMKFKGSMDISKDVIVREGTSTGYIDFSLESVDMSSIILRSIDKKLKKIVPMSGANDRPWVVVQRRDEPELTKEMESQPLTKSIETPEDD